MAKFVFEAKDPRGRMFRGELEAPDEAQARVKLRAQRLVPVKLAKAEQQVATAKKIGGRGVPLKDLQVFTRQLSTLLASGIPILQ